MSNSPSSGPSPTVSSANTRSSPSYSSQLYSYLYNGVASISNAVNGETKLQDNVSCYVMSRCYNGPKTSAWATEAVQRVAYFTYRKGIPRPLKNGSDHDAGWGCMIRTGQMMMCQVLRRLFRCESYVTTDPIEFTLLRPAMGGMSRENSDTAILISPRGGGGGAAAGGSSSGGNKSPPPSSVLQLSPRGAATTPSYSSSSGAAAATSSSGSYGAIFLSVQEFFMDTPEAPFGLHRMTEEGALLHTSVGTWFSPTVLARSLVSLTAKCVQVNERLTVYAALDQAIPQKLILQTMLGEEKAFLLLVPLMLGMTSIGKSYEGVFLKLLELPSCVGLVGGKPMKSLYFVGHQEDNVFYLDPHVVQPAFVSRSTLGNVGGPRGTTPVSSLDPCLLASFYFEREDQFLEWCDSIEIINRMGEFPILSLGRSRADCGPSSFCSNVVERSSSPTVRSGVAPLLDPCDFDEEDL